MQATSKTTFIDLISRQIQQRSGVARGALGSKPPNSLDFCCVQKQYVLKAC